MQYAKPVDASDVDSRLAIVGIKARVIKVLEAAWNVRKISDVTCWTQVDSQGQLVIVAHYRRVEESTPYDRRHGFWTEAVFSADGKMPFGPYGSEPLPEAEVQAARRIHHYSASK